MRNGPKNALALLATLAVVGTVLAGCSGGSASQIIDQKSSERSDERSNSDAPNRDVTRIRPGSPAYAPGLNYYEVAIPRWRSGQMLADAQQRRLRRWAVMRLGESDRQATPAWVLIRDRQIGR